MKGIVFTEFFRHVEEQHGEELLDEVIVESGVENGGAYSSVGTYPFDQMLALVGACVGATSRSLDDLLDGFGQHCFRRWVDYVPSFFAPGRDLFDILSQINDFHEIEVRKLYPDAELPTFLVETRDEHELVIGYYSSKSKQLTDLAIGVIRGAASHLGDQVEVSAEPADGPLGPYSRLRIVRQAGNRVPETRACPRHQTS